MYIFILFLFRLELCRSDAAEIANRLEACEDELKDLGAALEEMMEIFERTGTRNHGLALVDTG